MPVQLGFDGKPLKRDDDVVFGNGSGYGSEPLPGNPVPPLWLGGWGS